MKLSCKSLLATVPVVAIGFVWFAIANSSNDPCQATLAQKLITDQTSAGLYMNEMRRQFCPWTDDELQDFKQHPQKQILQKQALPNTRFLLTADLYIKAHSYAWMNKLFFVLAALFGLLAAAWPALGIMFKTSIGDKEWHKSPTMLTTLSAITGLMITVYSDYKTKQTSIENLMREVRYADESKIDQLSSNIIRELSRIDNGFSFEAFENKTADK